VFDRIDPTAHMSTILVLMAMGCAPYKVAHDSTDVNEETMFVESGAKDTPVTVIPSGEVCHHWDPINVHFRLQKEVYDRLATEDTRARLVEQFTGACVREESVSLKLGEREEHGTLFGVWVPDVFKAPSLPPRPNRIPAPTGVFVSNL